MTIRLSTKRKRKAVEDLQSTLNTSFNIQFDEIQQDVKINGAKVDTKIADSETYTLQAGDEGRVIEVNAVNQTNINIPPDSSYDFPVGTQIDILRIGTGEVVIAPGSGVVLDAAEDALTLRTQFSAAGIIKRSSNRWIVIGDTIP